MTGKKKFKMVEGAKKRNVGRQAGGNRRLGWDFGHDQKKKKENKKRKRK